MASEHGGVWSVFERPAVYEAFHHLIGARRRLKVFAIEKIRARPGDRVLDLGCGSGWLLAALPPVTYIGIDRNAAFIRRARQAFGERGEFRCDNVVDFNAHDIAPVDVVIALGLLHHLDDATAARLMGAVAAILKPRGRLVTFDPCYHDGQPAVTRFVVSHDRGRHVRRLERYRELVAAALPKTDVSLVAGLLPFPHSVCIVEGSRESA